MQTHGDVEARRAKKSFGRLTRPTGCRVDKMQIVRVDLVLVGRLPYGMSVIESYGRSKLLTPL